MSSPGTLARQRFQERMAQIAIGATLVRLSRPWTVVRQQRQETGVELTLKHGRRQFHVQVPLCHTGPVLWQVGLRAAAAAPSQHSFFGGQHHA